MIKEYSFFVSSDYEILSDDGMKYCFEDNEYYGDRVRFTVFPTEQSNNDCLNIYYKNEVSYGDIATLVCIYVGSDAKGDDCWKIKKARSINYANSDIPPAFSIYNYVSYGDLHIDDN